MRTLRNMQNRLCTMAIRRYAFFQRVAVYADQSKLWWTLFTIGVTLFILGSWWSWVLNMLILVAVRRWGVAWRFLTTCALVEWLLWTMSVLWVVGLVGVVLWDTKPTTVLGILAVVAAMAIHNYLLVDMMFPPRQRKKVKVSIKLPVRQATLSRAA